jgi:tetratricopeptide (TPR) repeat protein
VEEVRFSSTTAAHLFKWATPALAFAAVLAVLMVVNRPGTESLSGLPASTGQVNQAPPQDTESLIAGLQEAVRADPAASGYALLGDAYYQRARETGDPAYYSRAEGSFNAALNRDPNDLTATLGKGTLALARHDFRAGLELARRARRLAPDLVRPYAVLADAQIELGRYAAAAASLERMAALKPTLATYSRISYYRELDGDLVGAVEAMRLAASAGGGSAEGTAYVQSLLGNLELDRGRYGAAERAYREALAGQPSYPMAEAGLARLDAGRGRFASAIRRYRRVSETIPLPEYAIGLAEAEQAAGRLAAARRDYALVEAQARLLRSNGVNADVDLALFEANHGDPSQALSLGRRAWAEAPSVRSADAYSWALYRAGRIEAASRFSQRAMRLGSRDPYFLYHAGIIARAAGDAGAARRLLARLVAQSPRFSPLYGPRAKRALEALR